MIKRTDPINLGSVLLENPRSCAAIFSMVQAGLLLIDAESHTIVDANPWALKMIGAPREQVVGSVCHHFICPAELGNCPVTDLCKHIDNSERVLLTAAGRQVPILKTVSRLTLEGKEYLIESFLDISEQENARRELAASEERYRDLFENANDLIQMVSPDGVIQYVNRSWKETLGYSDEDLRRITLRDIIHPDHLDICMLAFRKLLGGENIDSIETTFVARDGRSVELEGSINCNMVGGRPVSSRGIFRNVTARKKAEKKRLESEQRYHDLFNNVSDLIQMVRPDGSFAYVNPALLETLGYDREAFQSVVLFDLIPADFRDQFRDSFARLLDGKKSGMIETEFKTRSGRRIPVEGMHNIQYVEGEIAGIRFIWRNITERKRAARKVQEWNRKLELTVETKTRQLREAQASLLRTGKMAAIGGLVAGTAHELNNPLGGILNAVDVLRQNKKTAPPSPETEEEIVWLDAIASAAERCNRIVDDLRNFSEHSRCRFESVDINRLLLDTVTAGADHLERRGIAVEDGRDLSLPVIEGDPAQLRKVLENILKNARTAIAENGSIAFQTRLLRESERNEPAVQILISDDGCGIAEEDREKIFDPFFTTRPVGQGTGLGLSVSYGIVKRHNGEIDVDSTPGRGTRVTVTLPIRQRQP